MNVRLFNFCLLVSFISFFSCSTNDIDEFELVFVGDSRVYYFPLTENYPFFRIKKIGVLGAKFAQVLDIALNESGNSKVFVFAGVNDILSFNSNYQERVVQEFMTNLEMLDNESRERLYIISILPFTKTYREGVDFISINQSLKKGLGDLGIDFIDITSSISDSEGFLENMYSSDGLHLNRDGYRQLTTALLPWITK